MGEFYARSDRRSGFSSRCKDCQKEHHRKTYPARREKVLERMRAYGQREAAPIRERQLQRKYGIDLDGYAELYCAQASGCAICGVDHESRSLAVDHDHVTGRVRALLCGRCNTIVGKAHENPDLLRLAADYLESYGEDETTIED